LNRAVFICGVIGGNGIYRQSSATHPFPLDTFLFCKKKRSFYFLSFSFETSLLNFKTSTKWLIFLKAMKFHCHQLLLKSLLRPQLTRRTKVRKAKVTKQKLPASQLVKQNKVSLKQLLQKEDL
jgi:hypothetical protein